MEALDQLTPAEVKVLVNPAKTPLKDLLRLTFFDLLMKKVLQLHKPSATEEEAWNVKAGERFASYQYLPHEKPLLALFEKDADLVIPLEQLLKSAFKKTYSGGYYQHHFVRKSPRISNYFKTSFWKSLVNSLSLTEEGAAVASKYKALLDEADEKIGELLKRDQEAALQILASLGGSMLLLQNFKPEMLQAVAPEAFEAFKGKKRKQRDGDGPDEGDDYYYDTDSADVFDAFLLMEFVDEVTKTNSETIFDAIDSSMDAAADSAGGDSGDGGGCSGCGGD